MDIYSIYKITNLVNGKVYIGKTVQRASTRFIQHISSANRRSRSPIHCAIRKYGRHNFSFDVIFVVFRKEDLTNFETYFIREYDCCRLDGKHKGYNLSRGGEGLDPEIASKLAKKRIEDGTHHILVPRTCVFCNHIGFGVGMHTHHFENCKQNPNRPQRTYSNEKTWRVVKPDGEVVVVKNMSKFCRENGLLPAKMCEISRGTRNIHKGFTCTEVKPYK